jgi:DNA-binding response OmpR family regulator
MRLLERLGAQQLIHTVRGVGYVLREPDGQRARA